MFMTLKINLHIQGQARWGPEEPDLVEDIPSHCRDWTR